MVKKYDLYHEVGDSVAYIKTKFGTRFYVVFDHIDHYCGLFDFNFPDRPIMSNSEEDSAFALMAIGKARGDILVTGLGLGILSFAIMRKENVISIDVVEKYQEVIDLIAPQVPFNEKVNIICNDIMDFVPTKTYDVIIINTVCEELQLEEEKQIRMKDGKWITDEDIAEDFKKHLKAGGESFFYSG